MDQTERGWKRTEVFTSAMCDLFNAKYGIGTFGISFAEFISKKKRKRP